LNKLNVEKLICSLSCADNLNHVDTKRETAARQDPSVIPSAEAEDAQEVERNKISSPARDESKATKEKPKAVFTIVKPHIIEKTDGFTKENLLGKKKDASLKFSKYDTLDKVQDYLRKTPLLPINVDDPLEQNNSQKLERRDSSSSNTISLS